MTSIPVIGLLFSAPLTCNATLPEAAEARVVAWGDVTHASIQACTLTNRAADLRPFHWSGWLLTSFFYLLF